VAGIDITWQINGRPRDGAWLTLIAVTDRRTSTVLLAVGHGSVDIFQGIVPVMVPFLVAERHYDYLAVSGFVLAANVLSSVVQPLFGLLTDRWSMRWLLGVATVCTGLGVALVE
jgi:FSR family fosmidomycin resistance protein-like MFS transporter